MRKVRHVPRAPGTASRPPDLRALFLASPRYTLSVAESITCGGIQAAIGSVSGASDFFVGGLTAYALAQKVRHLGVDVAEAERTQGVSALVAAQMAAGACRLFRSDFAVATTGYAEPDTTRGVRDPMAFWAVARAGGPAIAVVRQGEFRGRGLARTAMQRAVVNEVLEALADLLRTMRLAAARSNFA